MTKPEFDKCKMLMKRNEVIAAGIPRKAIRELERSGQLTCVILHLGGYRLYHKASVAKVLGI